MKLDIRTTQARKKSFKDSRFFLFLHRKCSDLQQIEPIEKNQKADFCSQQKKSSAWTETGGYESVSFKNAVKVQNFLSFGIFFRRCHEKNDEKFFVLSQNQKSLRILGPIVLLMLLLLLLWLLLWLLMESLYGKENISWKRWIELSSSDSFSLNR